MNCLIINKRSVVHYLLLYLLIISQGSVLFGINQDICIILILILSCYFIVLKRVRLEKGFSYFIIILFVCLGMVSFITNGSLSIASVLNVCSNFFLAYIAYGYDKKNFPTRFVKITTILSIIGLIMFAVQIVNFGLIKALLPQYIHSGYIFYGQLLFSATEYPHLTKNIGLATEPGRHQIYLIAAIYVCVFKEQLLNVSEKVKKRCLIILIIALITTQSTTGYISLAILIIGRLLINLKNKNNTQTSKTINRVIIIMLVVVIGYLLVSGENNLIQRIIINKLFDSTGKVDFTVSTGGSRVGSMLTDLSIAIKNPLGLGFEKYQSLWANSKIGYFLDTASCSGLTISCAALGFPATIIMIGYYIYCEIKNIPNNIEKIVLVLILINLSLSQPSFYYAPMIVCFMINSKRCLREGD